MTWYTRRARKEDVTEAPFVVVDTSVALKWHLEDKDDVAKALALLEDYRCGRISLLAPDNIRWLPCSRPPSGQRDRADLAPDIVS